MELELDGLDELTPGTVYRVEFVDEDGDVVLHFRSAFERRAPSGALRFANGATLTDDDTPHVRVYESLPTGRVRLREVA